MWTKLHFKDGRCKEMVFASESPMGVLSFCGDVAGDCIVALYLVEDIEVELFLLGEIGWGMLAICELRGKNA